MSKDMKIILENWKKFSNNENKQEMLEEGVTTFAKSFLKGLALTTILLGAPSQAQEKQAAAVGRVDTSKVSKEQVIDFLNLIYNSGSDKNNLTRGIVEHLKDPSKKLSPAQERILQLSKEQIAFEMSGA